MRRVLLCCLLFGLPLAAQQRITVGSKPFTESAVLAELMAQMIEAHSELQVERKVNLGGTMICWQALVAGEIDLYPEYTGTAWSVILKETGRATDPLRVFMQVRRRCREEHGVHWLEPFGLDNSYAIAMTETRAAALGIRRISDLLPHQVELRGAFSIEFGKRPDGYPGLVKAYGLRLGQVRVVEHGLAYQAMQAGSVDLIDAYSTDGKLLRYKLRVLEDDLQFFPPYHAAPVLRVQALQAHPELESVLGRLGFRLSDSSAQALNYLVEAESQPVALVARAFLELEGLVEGRDQTAAAARTALARVLSRRPTPGQPVITPPGLFAALAARAGVTLRLTLQHLGLTLAAVALAIAVAVPLGILILDRPRLRSLALAVAGIMQTVPSLALLAFMIPLLGLGVPSAIAALFLYAVLPILRNTYTGIREVDPDLVEAAHGMGMKPRQMLFRVQLPLASRTIMAGIRTATVISIGVATLAAFIGAGGLGEAIVEGLYLADVNLILSGAIPAASLALLADLVLGRLERRLGRAG